ncbi:MAG TPA: shikimate kinase, partial [Candidatus Limnocylindrales bacterium]|nr:shikimate kinase [Candidatus Limnocylindrales bacterium]
MVDVVLVGLPGSGKSAVGRRLAHRHGATFVDLDESIEKAAGQPIPDIFADRGEPAFRALEREAVAQLGPADPGAAVRTVVATGGGAVVDPRNRWTLYRGRVPIWLDVRPEVLAQRLRRSPNVRPLITGRDPMGTIRDLARDREPYYSAAHRL